MTSPSVRINGNEEKQAIERRGVRSVSNTTEEKVKKIYNDCWKIYREYTNGRDMALYNQRIAQLCQKYHRDPFLINILYAFAPVMNGLHAEYLMESRQ
nr:MAG TPA: hypothetical protein [Caudoviricetes sp.]